jgi:hypothetical protein
MEVLRFVDTDDFYIFEKIWHGTKNRVIMDPEKFSAAISAFTKNGKDFEQSL